MIKSLSFLALFSSLCFSDGSLVGDKSPAIKQSYTQATYDLALKHFKNKEYEKAYKLFNEIFPNDMGNILLNFYLGRSAYETKRYILASSAYERILIQEPKNNRVRIELGQTYMMMQLYAQAKEEFILALKGKLPPIVRTKVENNIALINAKEKKHFFNVTTLFGLIYDSNINASPKAADFSIYSPTLNSEISISNDGDYEDTMITQLATIFSYKYKPKDDFFIDTTLTPFMLNYKDYSEKDLHALLLDISPTFINKDEKYTFSFLIDKIYLGRDKYQFNYYLNPKYSKILSENKLYEITLKVGRINYEKELKDSNSFLLGNTLKYATEDYGVFTINFELGKERALNDSRTDVSLSSYNFFLSNKYDMGEGYSLQSGLGYKITNYDDKDVNFLTKRKDKKLDASLSLQKVITNNMAIILGATYTNSDSNHQSFIYNKHTLKANLIYSF